MNIYCVVENLLVRKAIVAAILEDTGLRESSSDSPDSHAIYLQDDDYCGMTTLRGWERRYTKLSIEEFLEKAESLKGRIKIGSYFVECQKDECKANGVTFTYEVVKEIVSRLRGS